MPVALTHLPLRRIAYAVAAVAVLALTIAEAVQHGLGWSAAIGLIAPDLALLAGAGPDLEKGQLHPRAVGLYNALHRYPGPVALLALGAVAGLGVFVVGLAWATHVTVDRAVGYGLRDARGFQRAH